MTTDLDKTLRARRSRVGRRLAGARKAAAHRYSLTPDADPTLDEGPWEPEVAIDVEPHPKLEPEEP